MRLYDYRRFLRNCGFSLIELSIVVAVVSVVLIGSLRFMGYNAALLSGKSVAVTLDKLNNELSIYMVSHYKELIGLPTDCSLLELRPNGATPKPAISTPANCQVTFNGVTVANGMQPTLRELFDLGLTNHTSAAERRIGFKENSVVDSAGRAPEPGWQFLIERVCLPQGVAVIAGAVCPNDADLRSLVFSTQAVSVDSSNDLAKISEIGRQLGDDFVMTHLPSRSGFTPPNGSDLYNLVAYGSQSSFANPIGEVLGIIGARSGFGSSKYAQFVRRDGASKPTADWNFNNYFISQAAGVDTGYLRVSSLQVAGDTCDPLKQNLAVSSDTKTVLVCDNSTNEWVAVSGGDTVVPGPTETAKLGLNRDNNFLIKLMEIYFGTIDQDAGIFPWNERVLHLAELEGTVSGAYLKRQPLMYGREADDTIVSLTAANHPYNISYPGSTAVVSGSHAVYAPYTTESFKLYLNGSLITSSLSSQVFEYDSYFCMHSQVSGLTWLVPPLDSKPRLSDASLYVYDFGGVKPLISGTNHKYMTEHLASINAKSPCGIRTFRLATAQEIIDLDSYYYMKGVPGLLLSMLYEMTGLQPLSTDHYTYYKQMHSYGNMVMTMTGPSDITSVSQDSVLFLLSDDGYTYYRTERHDKNTYENNPSLSGYQQIFYIVSEDSPQ